MKKQKTTKIGTKVVPVGRWLATHEEDAVHLKSLRFV